jgi:hypothetical protein
MEQEQNTATITLATAYGDVRDKAKELREAQQRALNLINARFWNSGLNGCADAARRIGPRLANVLREATALDDEATRLVDQMRDAVRAAPYADVRLASARRPHEPAPAPTAVHCTGCRQRSAELLAGGARGVRSRGCLTS